MSRESKPNPFQTLYLTEALTDPELYWDLFSPEILTGEAKRLFREGNVVLLGSNGTGKTMLLRLFDPAVQAAYIRHNRQAPIPEDDHGFLSVSVNFVVAGVGALGRRRISQDPYENLTIWSLIFGDFLNFYLVNELLGTLYFLCTDEGKPLAKRLDARIEESTLDAFSLWLAKKDCWFGALSHARSFHQLKGTLASRIYSYRSFANWNRNELAPEIESSKTEIGLPLSEARIGLGEFDILDPAIPLMVTVDQYETLIHIDYETRAECDDSIGRSFCRVVNSLMATRNPRVSYKVGVRPYSWGREMRAFGTDARLELGRDYQRVSLDEILRRKEDRSAWIFPQFARDVANRRMAWILKTEAEALSYQWPKDCLEELSPEQEINKYCARNQDQLRPKDKSLPENWKKYLSALYDKSKLEAKMAEVWIRQLQGRGEQLPEPPTESSNLEPWNRPYWQKERRDALLMQIASSCRQRRLYGGWDNLITFCGYNILVFLSLCREIWDISERAKSQKSREPEPIAAEVQTLAIRLVAEDWLNKQREFPGGAKRQEFVTRLGIGIRKALLADEALAYPGHNGFSLLLEEYESQEGRDVRSFLENATDFGALISSPHTTKERDKRPRRKWYLFPILCPNFEIPAVRTKEPYYASLSEIRSWLSEERPPIVFSRNKARASREQPSLFDLSTGEDFE